MVTIRTGGEELLLMGGFSHWKKMSLQKVKLMQAMSNNYCIEPTICWNSGWLGSPMQPPCSVLR
jgi:hypothetical protein